MPALTHTLEEFFALETLGSFTHRFEMLEVDGVLVDVENVVRRRYRCDTSCCIGEAPPGGRSSHVGDCCHGAEVRLTPHEREGLRAHLQGVLPYMEEGPRQALEARLARYRRDP